MAPPRGRLGSRRYGDASVAIVTAAGDAFALISRGSENYPRKSVLSDERRRGQLGGLLILGG
jgi:hypothetical protein